MNNHNDFQPATSHESLIISTMLKVDDTHNYQIVD